MAYETDVRAVEESPIQMGENEEIQYKFLWANIGTPSSPTITVVNAQTNATVTGVTSGSAATSGTNIITPKILNLTADTTYRILCEATVSGNVLERYVTVDVTS